LPNPRIQCFLARDPLDDTFSYASALASVSAAAEAVAVPVAPKWSIQRGSMYI